MKKPIDTKSIIHTIDEVVKGTGYPVIARVMKPIGVGREELRYMERKGLLKSLKLSAKGQIVKGYYANVWPAKLNKLVGVEPV